MEIKARSFAEAYSKIRANLLSHGAQISPRDLKTLELTNITVVLSNPKSRLGFNPYRHFSLPFAVAESALLFTDTADLTYISYFNRRIKNFSDDGKTLYGSYGHRIAKNIYKIVEKLQKDPYTRQAVLQIYQEEDLLAVTKDVPCTNHLQFMIRNDKLDLYTTMRSNDFVWGFPYDLFQFTVLQEIIANELHIDVGKYVHRASSMHVYDTHIDLITSIKAMEEVHFNVEYDVLGAIKFANSVMNLKNTDILGDSAFEQIMHAFREKKENGTNVKVKKHVWANRFLN